MKRLHRLGYLAMRAWWLVRRPLSVGVRVLLIRDDAILLIKPTYLKHWYLPGGGVEKGETLEEAVRREAAEEAGATLGDVTLVGAFSSFRESKSDHVVLFLSTDFEVSGDSDWEIEEVRWFPLDDLPAGLSPATARRIQELRDGRTPIHGRW